MTVQELNQHPLNQAALQRLRQEKVGERPRVMHLLQLALVSLEDEHDPRADLVAGYLTQDGPAVALDLLDQDLEPKQVLELPLPELLAEMVLTLRPRPPRD